MDIRTTRDVYNPLLRRREVSFLIEHDGTSTPKLYDVRKGFAAKIGATEDTVFVRSLGTLTGTTRAVGEAEVYDSQEEARTLVPKYVLARNMPERHKTKESASKEGVKEASKRAKSAKAKA